MNKRLFTFFLGLIIVIVLGKLMFVERHSESDDYYELFASFNKVDGVNPGDNVMISGINVGYVEEVILKKLSFNKNENKKRFKYL